jgi:hypothetical protein
MDQITHEIWIGNFNDANDHQTLGSKGICSILCLDGCLRGIDANKVGVERIEVIELIDGAGNRPEVFMRAVGVLKHLKATHAPVLVHCHAGQSRSAAVVCKLFMSEGASLAEAMKRITAKRRVAIVAGLQEVLDF